MTETEWAVRYPSGTIDLCDNETEARDWAASLNHTRGRDLPQVTVVRRHIPDWEAAE